jgi:hypothetical protein
LELALFLKFLRRRIDPNVRVVVANPAFGSLDPWMTAKIGTRPRRLSTKSRTTLFGQRDQLTPTTAART